MIYILVLGPRSDPGRSDPGRCEVLDIDPTVRVILVRSQGPLVRVNRTDHGRLPGHLPINQGPVDDRSKVYIYIYIYSQL